MVKCFEAWKKRTREPSPVQIYNVSTGETIREYTSITNAEKRLHQRGIKKFITGSREHCNEFKQLGWMWRIKDDDDDDDDSRSNGDVDDDENGPFYKSPTWWLVGRARRKPHDDQVALAAPSNALCMCCMKKGDDLFFEDALIRCRTCGVIVHRSCYGVGGL